MATDTQEIRQRLQLNWSIDPKKMWIPLVGEIRDDVIYFNFQDFDEVFGILNLQKLVARLASEPLFAISEIGEDEQVDYDSIKTFEDSGRVEMYYCNQQASWVIYVSHEATITIGGKVLIEELKKQWIDLKLYTNPWPGIC